MAADDCRHFGVQCVARALVAAAQREHQYFEQAAEQAVGEVAQQVIQRLFGVVRFSSMAQRSSGRIASG